MAVPRNNPNRAKMVVQAQKLHKAGLSNHEIAERIGVVSSTVHRYLTDPTGKRALESNRRYNQRVQSGKVVRQDDKSWARWRRVQQARALRREGKNNREIGKKLGINLQTVSKWLNDPRVPLSREDAEVEFNRMDLPISEKIRMRPVWRRRQRRIYGQNTLPPPTEEERQDAIAVLSDKRLETEAPALWFDAFLIFDEAGQGE